MKIPSFLLAAAALVTSAHAVTIATSEGTGGNQYGNASGALIEFDATPTTADLPVTNGSLVAGQQYSVDSVSFQAGASASATTVWLGAYRTLTPVGPNGADTVSDLIGVSTNSVDFSTAGLKTFNFDNVNVTAGNSVGEGTDIIYFVYQTSATPVSALFETRDGAVNGGNNNLFQTDRVNGDQESQNYRAMILDGAQDYRGARVSDILGSYSTSIPGAGGNDRIPLYQAELTAVPEPSTSLFGALAALGALGLRRRK